jgi:chaperonin GroES
VNLLPLTDRIIIRRLDPEENPDSLIVIPDRAKEKSMLAEVVSVGPGRDHQTAWIREKEIGGVTFSGQPAKVPMSVEVGDVILVGKYAGIELEYEEEDYAILAESEVLARLPRAEAE